MKTLKSTAILALVFLFHIAGFSQTTNCSINVRAWIDGISRLVINRNSTFWDHLAFHQPGRSDGNSFPTYLDGFPWYPEWPGADDQIVSCSPLPVITDFKTNIVTLSAIAARGTVQIIQLPNSTNGQTLIVEFDDGPPAGADWYEIELVGLSVEFQSPLSIQVASVALSWFARTNRVYQLQYTANLSSPAWIDLGTPIQGTGTNVFLTDDTLAMPKRYYRVIVVQ